MSIKWGKGYLENPVRSSDDMFDKNSNLGLFDRASMYQCLIVKGWEAQLRLIKCINLPRREHKLTVEFNQLYG